MKIKKEHKGLMFPEDIEYNYSLELKKIVKVMEKKLLKLITQRKNEDLPSGYEEEFLEYMGDYLNNELCIGIAVDYTAQSVEYAINQVNGQVKNIKAVNIKEQAFYDEKVIKQQIKDNVKLIKAEPEKYLRSYDKQVQKLVKESVEDGWSTKTLKETIKRATGIEDNRANLIARDQVGKIFGEATKTQFKGIGLKKFEWVTVGDNRVRETHADRAGQIYEWDNPPDGQIPGSDYQCRCVASIVVDEILEL
ncbi:phage head morphogenesis protein [Cetobacterium sp.]|uniref:phage head morphogenesis protein n=2 Tax=Cetobacterium sp. TaxID=2071632 RepID=UPI003F376610